ncbi:MAG: fumarate/nitrate reduction transcriptional regulator Fnr [Moraxellaceae bacterium]
MNETRPAVVILHRQGSSSCAECALNPVCLPPAVAEADLDQLENIIERRRPLPRGSQLFQQGDTFNAVYAVRSGGIKTCITGPDGAEQITGFYLPGEIVGLDGIANGHHGVTATVLESTAVCTIPFSRLEALTSRLPGLQHHLFTLLSREIQADQQLLLLLGKRSAEARLAAFLLSLSTRHQRRGLSGRRFLLPMSRTDIGNHLGLAIETVSRLFTRLQQSGVLAAEGKDITLLDSSALCLLAEPAAECADEAGKRVRQLS